MAELIVDKITHYFDQDRVILDEVSFQINAGERVGLLGINGAGKSTLLRIITGELTPVSGRVIASGGKRVGYVPQMPVYPGGATGEDVMKLAFQRAFEIEKEINRLAAELSDDADDKKMNRISALSNELEALGGYDFDVRINKTANGLGITNEMRNMPYEKLSGGEQMRVNLAKLILEDADILILDEPTNHLDLNGILWLEEYLKTYRGAVLAVSHDRYFLNNIVSRIIEITRFGMASFYSGNFDYYAREKEERYERQLKQFEIEQAKIRQLEETARRMHTWAQAYDNPYLHKRAFAIEKRIEWLKQTDKPVKDARLNAAFAGEKFRAQEAVVIKGVSHGYGDRRLFSGFSALVRGAERIAIVGGNGSGKTTLLRILLGEETPLEGASKTGPSVKQVSIPQKIEFAHPERTLLDTLLYELPVDAQGARDRLGIFMFGGENALKTVSQLSGGEKMRLKMCIAMYSGANLLILDEPTNHLDIPSREWIENAVSAFEGTLIFVSHDRYFINKFATRIWEIENGCIRDYDCGFEKYLSIRRKEEIHKKSASAAIPKAEKPGKPEPRSGKTERRKAALEREINKKETELEALRLEETQNASDYVYLQEIGERKDRIQQEIDQLYDEWYACDG